MAPFVNPNTSDSHPKILSCLQCVQQSILLSNRLWLERPIQWNQLVDDKIHAWSSGPYALVMQQPFNERSRWGTTIWRNGSLGIWGFQCFLHNTRDAYNQIGSYWGSL